MAEYFGPWLPSAYFGGGYWRQTGEPSADFADMAALVAGSGSATATARGRARVAALISGAGALTGTAQAGGIALPPPVQTRPPFAIIGEKPGTGKSLRKLRLEQQKAEDAILEEAIVALALELV